MEVRPAVEEARLLPHLRPFGDPEDDPSSPLAGRYRTASLVRLVQAVEDLPGRDLSMLAGHQLVEPFDIDPPFFKRVRVSFSTLPASDHLDLLVF